MEQYGYWLFQFQAHLRHLLLLQRNRADDLGQLLEMRRRRSYTLELTATFQPNTNGTANAVPFSVIGVHFFRAAERFTERLVLPLRFGSQVTRTTSPDKGRHTEVTTFRQQIVSYCKLFTI